jgi:uncharacterized glyoxalase superfamily protein PhnB
MPQPIPEGFNSVSAHLVVKGAAQAIEFYKKAFGAEEVMRMPGPDGNSIMHGELKIGNSTIMLADEFPGMCRAPDPATGSPVTVHLYVRDADRTYQQAVAAGATPVMPLSDMFWGDRYGKLKDPFGHEWSIATHKEDVSPEECGRRMAEFFKNKTCH